MKRTTIGNAIISAFAALTLLSCSELKNGLPSPVSSDNSAHPPAWMQKSSSGFHGTDILNAPSQYSLCIRCHAANFTGGTSGVSCMGSGCHIDVNGIPKSPMACNTCHGAFNAPAGDVTSWAPPRAVNGDTSESSPGVGAHQAHLLTDIKQPLQCQSCHNVPSALNDPGHMDTNPPRATVVIHDTLAYTTSGSGTFVPQPMYDPASHTCSGTYCHGSWRLNMSSASAKNQAFYTDTVMVGNFVTPVWTGGEAQGACGTCHDLPPKGHVNFNWTAKECGNCHRGIVDADGNISDPVRHMNGMVDVFGEPERKF